MAYFPNGTAGAIFEERWCSRCIHEGNHEMGEGCPVNLAHLLYAYELCNERDHPGKVILDMLIPDDDPTEIPKCAMFHERRDSEPSPITLRLAVEEQQRRYEAALREMRGEV